MNPTCDNCGHYIEADNRRWPGYCSPECRKYAQSNRNREDNQ